MSRSQGMDSLLVNCKIDLPVVSPGSNFSLRLGNGTVSGCGAESLSRKFKVSKSNAFFQFRFAVVLQDPKHAYDDQPRFEVYVKDPDGKVLECGTYSYRAQGTISGFQNCGDLRIKPWTLAGIDLSPYIGKEVTIEFLTTDCAHGGHYGYAYVDAEMTPLNFKMKVDSDTINNLLTLSAPDGFYGYRWMTGDTIREIVLTDPPKNMKLECDLLINENGCYTTISDKLKYKRVPLKPRKKHIELDTGMYAQVFRTSTNKIKLRVWDNAKEDGDEISVFVNNTMVAKDIKVTRRMKIIRIRLQEGENEIEVVALNQNIAKNTASIRYMDMNLPLNADKGMSKVFLFVYVPEK